MSGAKSRFELPEACPKWRTAIWQWQHVLGYWLLIGGTEIENIDTRDTVLAWIPPQGDGDIDGEIWVVARKCTSVG